MLSYSQIAGSYPIKKLTTISYFRLFLHVAFYNVTFFVTTCMIHPHTYIHPNARLATNVKVDPFTVIHQDVEIGEGTWIASNVTIMEGARIGKNCRIFPGAVLAAVPQDLK